MKTTDRSSLIALPIIVVVGILVALAGSQGGSSVAGIPVFAVVVGIAFLIQWLAFIPAFQNQTERFFDITGSLTYITVILVALLFSVNLDARSLLLAALVIIWAIRLGTFLFRRIHTSGADGRFDEIKPSFIRFLNVWTIQALWVTLTAAAALCAITTLNKRPFDFVAGIGLVIWIIGFAIEAVADAQKTKFAANPDNKGKFIQTGLWARSRHPNYFGEIALWLGVLIIALPVLLGWQLIGLLSPIFVALLLTRVSGIPLLEARADKKWAGQADYEAYKKRTPVLLPKVG